MIVKVQGGGKVYANTGSCSDVVSYLQHEDAERLQAGLTPEPFFNQEQDRIENLYHFDSCFGLNGGRTAPISQVLNIIL